MAHPMLSRPIYRQIVTCTTPWFKLPAERIVSGILTDIIAGFLKPCSLQLLNNRSTCAVNSTTSKPIK